MSSKPEDFSLQDVVNEAVDSVRPDMASKGLELKWDVPSWPTLRSDRARLLQCLCNYLSNAVKFTETGAITISVREDADRVHISIADTGTGIAEKDIGDLFEPFEKFESKLRVKSGGSGLGLHLVKKIATHVLKGDVSVESRYGEGSIFGLHIAKVLDHPKSEISGATESGGPAPQDERVLGI